MFEPISLNKYALCIETTLTANSTAGINQTLSKPSTQEFFDHRVLGMTAGITEFGGLRQV